VLLFAWPVAVYFVSRFRPTRHCPNRSLNTTLRPIPNRRKPRGGARYHSRSAGSRRRRRELGGPIGMARHGAASCPRGAWGSWWRGWWEMGWRQRWRRADRGRCPSAAGDTGKQLLHGKGGPETWAPLIRGADRWAKGKSEEMDGGIDLIRLGLNLSWERTKREKRRTCGTMIKNRKNGRFS
jgi:hypothetical protein